MAIATDTQQTALPALIELFSIDLSTTGQTSTIHRFQPSSTATISFGGNTYSWIPCEITGVAISSTTQATPTLAVSNVKMDYLASMVNFDDFLGAQLTYIKTFANQVNGQGSGERFSTRTYDIVALSAETKTSISFQLGTILDRDSLKLPARRATSDIIPGIGLSN